MAGVSGSASVQQSVAAPTAEILLEGSAGKEKRRSNSEVESGVEGSNAPEVNSGNATNQASGSMAVEQGVAAHTAEIVMEGSTGKEKRRSNSEVESGVEGSNAPQENSGNATNQASGSMAVEQGSNGDAETPSRENRVVNETTAGKEMGGAEVDSAVHITEQVLERLKGMCSVLGVVFKKKLLEMGVFPDENVDLDLVYNQMELLQRTIDTNHKKLKAIGRDLLIEWELSDTPFKKMIKYWYAISVVDSESPNQVTEPNYLDTLWVKRASNELEMLRKERKKQARNEYEKLKEKLKETIQENHLTFEDVGFNPKKKVLPDDYYEETLQLREQLEKVKKLAVGRKEMVYRIELLKLVVEQKAIPTEIIKEMMGVAWAHVEKLSTGDETIKYDGKNVADVFQVLEEGIEELQLNRQKQFQDEIRMKTTRTRSGGR